MATTSRKNKYAYNTIYVDEHDISLCAYVPVYFPGLYNERPWNIYNIYIRTYRERSKILYIYISYVYECVYIIGIYKQSSCEQPPLTAAGTSNTIYKHIICLYIRIYTHIRGKNR